MESLTLEACRIGKPVEKEYEGKRVYIRVLNGLQAIQYQDDVASQKISEIENTNEAGLRFDACLVKHFIVDQDNALLFADMSIDQIIEQVAPRMIYDLGSMVFEQSAMPISVEDAEKKS